MTVVLMRHIILLPDTSSNEGISAQSERVVTAWLEGPMETVSNGGTHFDDFKLRNTHSQDTDLSSKVS
jgi:hypothetical protein